MWHARIMMSQSDEAHCYVVNIRWTDCEQIRSRINNNWLQDVLAFVNCVQNCCVRSWQRPTWPECPASVVIDSATYVSAHNQFTGCQTYIQRSYSAAKTANLLWCVGSPVLLIFVVQMAVALGVVEHWVEVAFKAIQSPLWRKRAS